MSRETADRYHSATMITPYVIRPGRSTLRSTFQLAADVGVGRDLTPDQVYTGAVRVVLDWLESKFPQALPLIAKDLASFELDHHGQQQIGCVSVVEDGLWSVRLVQPDAPFRDRTAVAGRTWTTELALHRGEAGVRFAARIFCASAPYATEPIALTRPRVVIDLARRFGLHEIRPLDGHPWILQSPHDLQALHELLTDPGRTMPVVLLTQPNAREWPGRVAPYLLDHDTLARRMQGFAHVVCMPMSLGYAWTDMVGKVWSSFLGAVRTYRSGLDFENDPPFLHPRVLPDRILFWRYDDLEGEDAFAAFLIDKSLENAATKLVNWGGCLFLADAKMRRVAFARERVKQDVHQQRGSADEITSLQTQMDMMESLHDEEVAALAEQIKHLTEERDVALQMGEAAESERSRAIEESRKLQYLNDALRSALETRTGRSSDEGITTANDYEDIPEWVEQHLAGRLILHPRAVQGVKKARYEDIKFVCACLLLLAREYRDMRQSKEGARESWEERLRRLELRCGASITKERAGEQGDTYFVRYLNKRRFLELHLRKGSSKDERRCLAVYFFWCEDSNQVVVGWLPSHLDTRAT